MFAKLLSRRRAVSEAVSQRVFFESLESRKLLSVSSMGINLTSQDDTSPFPTGQIAETMRADFVALAGKTYSGTYTGAQGSASLSITGFTSASSPPRG